MGKENIKDFIIDGLMTDGGHHKQWYLETILEDYLGFSIEQIRYELHKEGYDYERGIPP